MQTTQGRNGCSEIQALLWPLLTSTFPVQKYHNQTNTPLKETQQTLLENVRHGPTPG
jgi:hypothetical protein